MPSDKTTTRVAIYARYSSDLQNPASIEDQILVCRAEIERRGWEVVAVYKDAGISGASALRPGYQNMLQDAVTAGLTSWSPRPWTACPATRRTSPACTSVSASPVSRS